jgi:hypothetical protein
MGTHDEDPDTFHPDYSVMRQSGRIDTLPAANRLHWLNWLTAETVTRDPSEISDLSGAISSDAKYLLDIGIGADGLQRYQELFEGEWIQYRWDNDSGAGTIYYEKTDVSGNADSDGDGENDLVDADDDNDGVVDTADAFPSDPTETADADKDGLGDNADQCDNTPPAETGAINALGCSPSDLDSDGDGVTDDMDAFPNDPNETLDSDGDGYGDNAEIEAGTDPYDANDQPSQSGLPIWLLYQATQ